MTTQTLTLKNKFTTELTNAAIDKVLDSVSSVREQIQTAAVMLLIDSYHTGDLGQINKLCEGLKGLNATNTNAVYEWFTLCGVQFDNESKSFVKRDKDVIKQAFAGNLIKSINGKEHKIQPNSFKWWMAKTEPEFKGVNVITALKQLVTRTEKAQAKVDAMTGEAKEQAQELMEVTPEQLQAIQAIIDAAA
jgi:2C-methyl-D-erythritol 2,4-cyclodiphosphate synthase